MTQIQQQRPESCTVTLTWHACKYKVHELHQRYILFSSFKKGCPPVAYTPYVSGTPCYVLTLCLMFDFVDTVCDGIT